MLSFGLPSVPTTGTINDIRDLSNPDINDPRRGTFSTGSTVVRRASLPVGTPISPGVTPIATTQPSTRLPSFAGLPSSTYQTARPLVFGDSVPSNPLSNVFGVSINDFLRTVSTGTPEANGGGPDGVYDDAILRQARQINPTTNVDGSTSALGQFRDLGRSILSGLGSSGDGDIVPVAFDGQNSQISPLVLGLGVLALGAVVYFATK